jgi:hypothetical protein
MKEKPVKIILPKDPYQIGQTKDGQPIWVDPKDFIQTPDEKLEQKDKMVSARFQTAVLKLAQEVIENSGRFLMATLENIVPESVFESGKSLTGWIDENGFEVIQDGLTTIIKCKGKVIRTMNANIEHQYAEAVSKRVMQLIKNGNPSPQSH